MKTDTPDWKSLGIAIERIDGESADAYQAFLQYAWLQGSERTTKNVAEKTGFGIVLVRLWCTDHKWVDRAAVIDGIKWRYEFRHREELVEKDNQEFAVKNREIKQKTMAAANRMLDVCNHLLEGAVLDSDVVETGWVTTEDGREVPTTTTINMHAKVSDIPRLADVAVKVARLAQDLPTEIVDHVIAPSKNLSEFTIEELMEMRERNQAKIREKAASGKMDSISEAIN